MRKRKQIFNLAYFGIILVLVLVILYSGLRILESTVFSKAPEEGTSAHTKTITRNGVDYFPRQDITVVLVLGIDQFGPMEDSGSYNNKGAADMVTLLIFDEQNQECRALCLNRDTMVEMPVLGIGGKQAGTIVGQLALSHTYGSGLEDSCENTKKTVSSLLYGISIDHYVAINMEAITILNDMVGGVPVVVTDDFSQIDPSITMGEVTLKGQQAIHFVRTRKGLGDQLNLSRMDRQKEYVDSFLEIFSTMVMDDTKFAMSAYDSIAPYMVTDCTGKVISSMMQRYADYTLVEMVSPEGENIRGEEYMEFYPDAQDLDELILRLFYAPKK